MPSTNVTTAYLLSTLRNELAELNSTGRWSDPNLVTWIDRANKALCRRVLYPTVTSSFAAVSGQALYDMSSSTVFPNGVPLKILRVDVGGQVLVPTTIDILEGTQVEQYDDTFTPTMQTQWENQAAATYPVLVNTGSGPVPTTAWTAGNNVMRPSYYLKLPFLGIIPAPSGTPTINVWNVPSPPTLVNAANEVASFPDIATDYIVNKALEYAFRSDGDNDAAVGQRALCAEGEAHVREWLQGLQGDFAERPRPVTYRGFYSGPTIVPKTTW